MTRNPPIHHIPGELFESDELLIQAARQYGTPLYLYDKRLLEKNWRTLTNHLPDQTVLHYSVKANPNVSIIHTLAGLGANFEVASMGELMAVLQTGVQSSHVIFVGPGKTASELHFAISQNVNVIVVESRREVDMIQRLASGLGKRSRIALRINPGTGKGMLSMGGTTQFGMEIKAALRILHEISDMDSVAIVGIHGYLGTQILDCQVIYEHARLILRVADELQQESGQLFSFVDIGGGFGMPYHETDQPLDLVALHSSLKNLFEEYCTKYPTTQSIAAESGRYLVGSAGVFISRVLDVKRFREQCFVILDGGINVFGGHDRYAGSRLTPIRVLDGHEKYQESLTVCGPLCTPLDRLAANALLPMPRLGGLLAFYLAGAYGYTASPGLFLSHGFPCEVLADGENSILIRERCSTISILAGQHFPQTETGKP